MTNQRWTPDQIPSQAGRRVLITGANSGIGYYTALELARRGAHVLFGCRDLVRGEAALRRLKGSVPAASVELAPLNLASLRSIREFTDSQLNLQQPLDLLINNAGVMAPPKRLQTSDGFELQFGTNLLGHFALTALLFPSLVQVASTSPLPPRIITIASIAHKRGQLNFQDLQSRGNYSPMRAYQQSKLANLMFALELGRRLQAAGSPSPRIRSIAAHPGVANTRLFQTGDYSLAEKVVRRFLGIGIGLLLNSGAQGALATLYAACSPDAVSGAYYGPLGFREMRGTAVGPAIVSPAATDRDAAGRLWSECELATGLHFLSQ